MIKCLVCSKDSVMIQFGMLQNVPTATMRWCGKEILYLAIFNCHRNLSRQIGDIYIEQV